MYLFLQSLLHVWAATKDDSPALVRKYWKIYWLYFVQYKVNEPDLLILTVYKFTIYQFTKCDERTGTTRAKHSSHSSVHAFKREH